MAAVNVTYLTHQLSNPLGVVPGTGFFVAFFDRVVISWFFKHRHDLFYESLLIFVALEVRVGNSMWWRSEIRGELDRL